jgi:hypothetical protein
MSYIGNEPLSVAFLTDTFSGNGSTVAFTMSVAPANTSSILVAVTGVVQDPSTYSVSGTTLTFSAAPPSGTSNISVRYLGIPASGVTTTAYRTVTDTTATAGQTSFTIPSYTVGYVDVFRNGVRLAAADFTATTGTTVVLASAASAGDTITTVSFYVSSVLNAIAATAGSVGTTYIADSSVTQAKLASGVAGNGPAFSAYQNTAQTGITNATSTKITFDVEDFDTNSNFASSRFTPTVAGYYQINAGVQLPSVVTTNDILVQIYKNGTNYKNGSASSGNNAMFAMSTASTLVYMNGSTDYIEAYVYGYVAAGSVSTNAGTASTYINGFLARSA